MHVSWTLLADAISDAAQPESQAYAHTVDEMIDFSAVRHECHDHMHAWVHVLHETNVERVGGNAQPATIPVGLATLGVTALGLLWVGESTAWLSGSQQLVYVLSVAHKSRCFRNEKARACATHIWREDAPI